jgi:hypothetical protein
LVLFFRSNYAVLNLFKIMDLPSVEALLLEKEELESQMKKLEEGAV